MKKLFLILVSIIFSLLLVETLVRLFYPQSLADNWTENENEFGLTVNKNNYLFKNHRVKQHLATYKFGSYRNRITIQNDNFENLPKILILGDSFTFGYRLNDQDTYISKLQNLFQDYYFINSASPNW